MHFNFSPSVPLDLSPCNDGNREHNQLPVHDYYPAIPGTSQGSCSPGNNLGKDQSIQPDMKLYWKIKDRLFCYLLEIHVF